MSSVAFFSTADIFLPHQPRPIIATLTGPVLFISRSQPVRVSISIWADDGLPSRSVAAILLLWRKLAREHAPLSLLSTEGAFDPART
jgi:hypothetical protein